MSKYRHRLPQLGDQLFITDGGRETTLVFNQRLEPRDFSAFELLRTADGCQILEGYLNDYLAIAKSCSAPTKQVHLGHLRSVV